MIGEVAMNISKQVDRRRDDLVAAAGVLILLLGTATGNALVMLAMSLVGLGVITIVYRRRLGRAATLALLLATVVASAITVWAAAGLN